MIAPHGQLRVYVATRPVDFRMGMDGLALAVQEMMKSANSTLTVHLDGHPLTPPTQTEIPPPPRTLSHKTEKTAVAEEIY